MHPAVKNALTRIHGIEWHYARFEYGMLMGVCGETFDGRRQAVRFELPKHFDSDAAAMNDPAVLPLIERAKNAVIESLARGEGVKGDELMEGHELTLETTK